MLCTTRYRRELHPRDGFLLVTLVWTVLPAFATLDQARAFAAREGGEWLTATRLRQGLPASLQRLAPHAH